jgi:hypothetical protein
LIWLQPFRAFRTHPPGPGPGPPLYPARGAVQQQIFTS